MSRRAARRKRRKPAVGTHGGLTPRRSLGLTPPAVRWPLPVPPAASGESASDHPPRSVRCPVALRRLARSPSRHASGNPRPRPRPALRPEKNGSNRKGRWAGSGPGPLSSTATVTSFVADCSIASRVQPSAGAASMALRSRLVTTVRTCPASAQTCRRSGRFRSMRTWRPAAGFGHGCRDLGQQGR